MRQNLPVTQRAYEIPADATLMSTTDPSSHISYANDAFIEASGFSAEEIMGQPHNLVRHPDMPPEAFRDMWETLKSGQSWTGLVKNRRKDGDHYWVRANATPILRNGRPIAFMSVRTKPTADEVAGAETLYRDIREGRAKGLRFHKGVVLKGGMGWATNWLKTMPVSWRLRLPLLLLLVMAVLAQLLSSASIMASIEWTAAFVVVAIGTMVFLEHQIVKPIQAIADHARRVAAGESRESLHLDRVDEIGLALRAVNQLGLMFRWVIDDVADQVVTVKTSSGHIATGNNEISARTEQAAASLQQTAASMEQMSATVKSNADAAQQAEQLAVQASAAAAQGGDVVREVNTTMEGITASSKRIGDIIGVIDGIAFQTNILALNAAVEAARAGEQGRGFAVVAGEVRTLAQRSAEAAREIKTLISDSVERVEAGGRQVTEASRAMTEIVQQVQRVNGLISTIGHATREQAAGISQVNAAVSDLDKTTQQNAALVQRSVGASDSLEKQATQLVQAVSVFRLGGHLGSRE
ncbi:methyl-accepting chemotaxis sensory transducer with Pas/Pac sensor [Roseateles sp. YR242]|uniref:methyl-accepting chemotaxis protein n=1 Tax=Roseateles sp. YR242 TaxID=1855305 RepID=UPI0008CAC763|nr:PAS domain-containing methyl-accepting chemotaxis protein [Roseateles sp. YR242]SEL52786.1 methyl-accepting chemotaxis sensory transducer with Pas/Pac sensor [Roseateles sp. YR242]